MYRGYKIRLYPTPEQEKLMWKHIHACRFMWNYLLELTEKEHSLGHKHLSGYDMMKHVTQLKQSSEYSWLYEVSNRSLQIICKDLNTAYNDYFRGRARCPKFKSSKKAKHSYPTRADRLHFGDGFVKVEKLKKVKIKQYVNPDWKVVNPRISYVNKKWILSFTVDCESQASTLTDKDMGIDLGIKEFATVAYGNDHLVFHNINKSKRVKTLNHKLKHIQRTIARKYNANGNFNKTQAIIHYENMQRDIYNKLSRIRLNYIHQVTHQLICAAPHKIVIEDLNVMGMMKNKYLSTAIQEQCFYEFYRQIKYKCEWNEIELVIANRWFPSSKTCSNCGKLNRKLRLSDRVYKCDCGLVLDRDYNAAINLMRYVPPTERCTA